MKEYKLLKDLPFAKAGGIFQTIGSEGYEILAPKEYTEHRHYFVLRDIENFDEWFEENKGPKEPEVYFVINIIKNQVDEVARFFYSKPSVANMKKLGLIFDTREEAEKRLKWLNAREILLEDTKGFKPDWKDFDQYKYRVSYNHKYSAIGAGPTTHMNAGEIFFRTNEDARNSATIHRKEWKIYLGIE